MDIRTRNFATLTALRRTLAAIASIGSVLLGGFVLINVLSSVHAPDWTSQFLSTLFAMCVALYVALWRLYRQAYERAREVVNQLAHMLDYIVSVFKPSEDPQLLSWQYVNHGFLSPVLASNQLPEMTFNLVRLQAKIEFYQLIFEEHIRRQNFDGKQPTMDQKGLVDRARDIMVDEAKCCQKSLHQLYDSRTSGSRWTKRTRRTT